MRRSWSRDAELAAFRPVDRAEGSAARALAELVEAGGARGSIWSAIGSIRSRRARSERSARFRSTASRVARGPCVRRGRRAARLAGAETASSRSSDRRPALRSKASRCWRHWRRAPALSRLASSSRLRRGTREEIVGLGQRAAAASEFAPRRTPCAGARRRAGGPTASRSRRSARPGPAPPSPPRRLASARGGRRHGRSASRRSRGRPPRSPGCRDSAVARTTISSLKPHKSSRLPPPRATMITSGRRMRPSDGSPLKPRIAAATSAAEVSPWTLTGQTTTWTGKAVGQPVQDVADHRAGRRGDDADHPRQVGERPLPRARRTGPRRRASSAASSRSAISAPAPAGSSRSIDHLVFRRAGKVVSRPVAITSMPSVRLEAEASGK